MAYVYADMDALVEYQQEIVQTLSILEGQIGCKEKLIEETQIKIRAAIECAENAERIAYASLRVAEEKLCQAEYKTRQYNAHLAENQNPMDTPRFYYDNVYEKERDFSCAQNTRANAENILSNFNAYVRNYEQQQIDGLEHIKKYLDVSGKFFENYIKKLIEVKVCTAVSKGQSINKFSPEDDVSIEKEETEYSGATVACSKVPGGLVADIFPVGWCASNSMTAVSVDKNGQKMGTMIIGGVEQTYPCTKSGMEKAYHHAMTSGNQDMIARTSAIFEIEILREYLELGTGETGFAQLGGYHKDVKKQDPIGYESHHIPSRATQDEDGEMLPAISITHADHTLTSSFAWKQRKTYHPVFPSASPLTNYKESIITNLKQGSSGYIDSIKNELLDLRSTTGHRYDGGVSAYLDAVIDMISTRGIPKAKSGEIK